jgi:hypothetical protein
MDGRPREAGARDVHIFRALAPDPARGIFPTGV